MPREEFADRVEPIELIVVKGHDDYAGEPVSQLEHGLQCAALAMRAGASDALVAAALFHDIGHLCATPDDEVMPELGVLHHEEIGAAYLFAAGYPALVCDFVRGHVAAKRYLVASNPRYAAKLTDASRRTLELQGGPFGAHEVAKFHRDPRRQDMLRMRAWDDAAKVKGSIVPDIDYYLPLLERVRGKS